MKHFDRNDLGQIKDQTRKETKNTRIGEVTQVYEHLGKNDDSNFEVDVETLGGTEREQRVPVETPGSGAIDVPKAGDKVLMHYRKGGKKPYVTDIPYSTVDRPPIGKAGMWRRQIESAQDQQSPSGQGDLYVTGYTSYDDDVASNNKRELTPEEAFVQIAKRREQLADPTKEEKLPAKIEFYDSPKKDESYISIEINQEDGSSSDKTWGIKFDIKDGTFTIADPDGFGIESLGGGDFRWHHKSIDFNEISGQDGPLNI